MGLYYYKSEEAQKAGEEVIGRVELLGVTISTEVDPRSEETIMILDSDFREIKCAAAVCLSAISQPASQPPRGMQLSHTARLGTPALSSVLKCAVLLVLCAQHLDRI